MKNKMLSILLTFCFLFSLTFPTLIAHADDEIEYQNLYFVTDTNDDLFDYKCDTIEQAMYQTGAASNFQSVNLSNSNSYAAFATWSNGISNSIVIVDLNLRMPLHDTSPVLSTQHLNSAFSRLKRNNCKIMFISGNDEDTYYSSRALLDHVDVHVNMDFIYFLVKAIITKITMNEDLTDYYFITDNNFTVNGDERSDFTYRWLLPYFEEIYGSDYDTYIPEDDEEDPIYSFLDYLAVKKNINFYGQVFGNVSQLRNYRYSSGSIDFDSNLDGLFNNANRAYMIGMLNTNSTETYNSKWYYMVNRLNEVIHDKVFAARFYASANSNSLGFNEEVEHASIGANRLMFYERYTPADGIYCLRDIVLDFLADEDMQKYNNINGRCEITYMPVTISEDAWIPESLVLDCYQVDS